MSDWIAISGEIPDAFDEEYTVRFADHTWRFRRVGSDSWLDGDGVGAVVQLPGMSKFGGFFAEPELAAEGTELLAATPPMLYIAVGDGMLGIEDVTCGTFDVTWYDLDNGRMWHGGERDLDGGDESFEPPTGATGRVALYLRRTSR